MIFPQKNIQDLRDQVIKDEMKENWDEYCRRKSEIPVEINRKIKEAIGNNEYIIYLSRAFNPLIL